MRRRPPLPAPDAVLRRGAETVARVRLCRSPGEQLRGLIGCPPLPVGAGIALPRCAAVHTAFVAGPIDVLFLREGRVSGIVRGLRPWRIACCPGATLAVELAAGSIDQLGIRVGETLTLALD